MTTWQQDFKDLLDNNTRYPDSLLNARVNTSFITIPQTTIDYEQLHKIMISYDQVKYCITKLEQHLDGGLHIHQVIRLKQQTRLKQIHQKIALCEGTIKGTINYQKCNKITAAIQYLKKVETEVKGKPYLEWGDTPLEAHRPSQQNDQPRHYKDSLDRQNSNYLHAIQLAEQGEIDQALEYLKTNEARDYIIHQNKIEEAIRHIQRKLINKTFNPPPLNPSTVTLKPQQQAVWDLLQEYPKERRIIWVTGHYGSGKTFLYNYIRENHEYGTYDAGQCASFDSVTYGYDEEGVIAWDLPKCFNFIEKGDSIASVIEKFSDFGTHITSKKYGGKSQRVRGHVIVFSNHDPIQQLNHRDIIHICLEPPPPDYNSADEDDY